MLYIITLDFYLFLYFANICYNKIKANQYVYYYMVIAMYMS